MLARRLGSLLVIRHNKNDATEQDWDEFLKFLSTNRAQLDRIRILIYTDGGIPTAPQRKRLAATLEGIHMLVGCVSDNIKVRFSGATIALFQKNYRQFSLAEIEKAYEHLHMTPSERERALAAFKELEADLSPS
jgi:hypothetical protein